MASHELLIRPAQPLDAAAIWAILEPILRAGETYALPRDMTQDAVLAYWMGDHETFVADQDGRIVGTYYFKPNQLGGDSHVANCGYATAADASGRGVGRAMCEHSLELARAKDYRAMQFNFVVSTNDQAVKLWQSLDFKIVGTLPAAFAHPTQGDVDALVMYRQLNDAPGHEQL